MQTTKISKKIPILRATHGSTRKPIVLNDNSVACYVLENGDRVLSGRGMQKALGLPQSHGTAFRSFLDNKHIKPFITNDLAMELKNPIKFVRPGRGGKLATGYKATLLTDVCEVVLSARKAGALEGNVKLLAVAEQCEILTRVFAKIGIIALIDEATGYQEVRDRSELQKLLGVFLHKELLPWEKTFPDEYYKQLFRLKNWSYDPLTVKRPSVVGKITNKLIYDALSPEIRKELQIRTPRSEAGNYTARFHQWMTKDIGSPILKSHIQQVIVLMRVSNTWRDFQRHFSRAFGGQQILELDD